MIKACVLCGVCISVFLTPVQAKEEVVQGVVQVQDDTGKPLEGAAFQLISYGDVYKRQALESIMLGMLTYLLQKRRMPDIFQKNQLNAIEKYVEQEVLEFDRPIRFS